ncbi:hypothetical protein AAHC03_05321 [Spirometra sp. Aus1]
MTKVILEELKTRIRRGETHEEFAGGELYYSGSREKEEIVKITGQLLKDVNILISVENKDTSLPLPEVEYRYYVSKTDAGDHLRFEPAVLAVLRDRPGDALARYQRSSRRQQSIEKAQHDPAQPRPAESGAAEAGGGGYNVSRNLRVAVTTIAPTTPTAAQKSANRFVWRMHDVPGRCTSCVGLVEGHASCYAVITKPEKAVAYSSYNFLKALPPEFCDESIRPAPAVYNCADFCGVRWTQKPDDLETRTNTTSLAGRGESAFRVPACSSRCGSGSRKIHLVSVCEEKVKVGNLPSFWRESQLGALACIKAGLGEAPKTVTQVVGCVGQCLPVHWNTSEWSSCSNQCGMGIATRQISCLDSSGVNWPPSECGKSLPTEVDTGRISMGPLIANESRKCFETAGCPDDFLWSVSEWSGCRVVDNLQQEFCSSSFARYLHAARGDKEFEWTLPDYLPGLQTRTVNCVMRNSRNSSEARVPDEYCQRISGNTPVRSQPCPNPICLRWGTVRFRMCSVACGSGYQQRTVHCVLTDEESDDGSRRADNSALKVQPDKICLERSLPRPSHWQVCKGPPCTYWKAEEWNECQGTCEGGIQMRRVRCLQTPNQRPTTSAFNSTVNTSSESGDATVTQELQPSMCKDQEKPEDRRSCPLSNDCPFWYKGPWSACSASCGFGIRYRQVDCRDPNGTVLYQFSPELEQKSIISPQCSSQRPLDRAECQRAPCRSSEAFWKVGLLSKCSAVGCSYGYQERAIHCLTADFRKVEPEYCDYEPPPLSRIPCTLSECKSYRWRVDPWSRVCYKIL